MDITTWSKDIASLIVDALIGAGYIRKDEFEDALPIVAEEILVRLALGDYPPSQEPSIKPTDET